MATTVTRTVNTVSGGDHLSMQLAEDWFTTNYPDFVTSDVAGVIDCAGSSADATNAILAGITTDTTRTLTVQQATSDAHNGVWSDTKYRHAAAAGYGIRVQMSNVRFSGLQLKVPLTSYDYGIDDQSGVTGLTIDGLLVDGGDNQLAGVVAISAVYSNPVISNTIVFNSPLTGIWTGGTDNSAFVYNCTVVGSAGTAYKTQYLDTVVKNCIAVGCTTDFYTNFSASSSNNISSDATAPGADSLINQVATDLMTAPGSGDFTLKAGSNAIGAGVSVGLTTDIAGNSWSSPPSIGAYEYITSGTTYYQSISGSIPAQAGSATTAVTFGQQVFGVLQAQSGAISKTIGKSLGGTLPAQSADISKAISKSLSGDLPSPSGSVSTAATYTQAISGILGALTGVVATALNPVGALGRKVKIIGASFYKILSGGR